MKTVSRGSVLINNLLINHIENNVPDSKIAVLLSGGVDSISIALATHHAGKKVHAYSFHLDTHETYDFIKAKEVSEYMKWDFTEVVVPTNNIVDDWKTLAEFCRKKTHFECVFPFLYVYPQIEEKYVLTGWGADGYFGPSKKAMMRYSSYKKKRNYVAYCKKHNQKRLNWNEFRIAYLDGDCAGLKEHTRLAEKYNKIHVTPYLDKKVRKFLMSKSWKELNKPRQKEIIRSDFTELEKFGTIKPHQNLHLNAGIDRVFKELLNNTDINFNNRKRMMDVCRDWYKRENNNALPI